MIRTIPNEDKNVLLEVNFKDNFNNPETTPDHKLFWREKEEISLGSMTKPNERINLIRITT